ncbi:F-box protein SKIP24 isoform X1 [Cannabis sativa]|uniref:F-box protein SKIP24 isoform X1 n=1 Tax=Cannabis sativa TaxID=3483 RepID=UPI0029CA7831|nr:F-box protein SKIP24 isoform X1 [Cannabis sativa]
MSSAAALPDELWRRILELGITIKTQSLSFKDLCRLSITSTRFRRLSSDDDLWSHVLSSDFSLDRYRSPLLSSKSLYKFRFEREREKKKAAHRREMLRKESQIAEHLKRIKKLKNRLVEEQEKMKATIVELSSLSKIRQASVALNVWQPEVVRGRHKQIVEQNVVPVESRVHAMDMELKLCRQQIRGFEKAYNDEKKRFDTAKEELNLLKYHPLRINESTSGVKGESEANNVERKKRRRCNKGTNKYGTLMFIQIRIQRKNHSWSCIFLSERACAVWSTASFRRWA